MPIPIVRIAESVLVLALPCLMVASSPEGFQGSRSILPIAGVEVVLLAGFAFAAAEKRRFALLAAMHEPSPRPKLGKATRHSLSRAETARPLGVLSIRFK